MYFFINCTSECAIKFYSAHLDVQNAFVLKDNLEYPVGAAIPLWMIGLLY